MVGGLDTFRDAFREYSDCFVIIGGTACEEVLQGTDQKPRATLDIDLIVIADNMTPQFARRFWQFISDGAYLPGSYIVLSTVNQVIQYRLNCCRIIMRCSQVPDPPI